jgi:hypothetical protein
LTIQKVGFWSYDKIWGAGKVMKNLTSTFIGHH